MEIQKVTIAFHKERLKRKINPESRKYLRKLSAYGAEDISPSTPNLENAELEVACNSGNDSKESDDYECAGNISTTSSIVETRSAKRRKAHISDKETQYTKIPHTTARLLYVCLIV